MTSELETNIVAVERVSEYTEIKSEVLLKWILFTPEVIHWFGDYTNVLGYWLCYKIDTWYTMPAIL